MIVTLKPLHGRLQNKQGRQLSDGVRIRSRRFVIGSAPDCAMHCRSRTVSGHHCEIEITPDGPTVRDLFSETGTFVNDQRLEHRQPLAHGDRLRIGRLEFEVLITAESSQEDAARPADPVGEYVSQLLVEADEQERARRLEDPEARHFHPEPASQEANDKPAEQPQPPEKPSPAKRRSSKPGKLPPPPPVVADNTADAAEECLNIIFSKEKRRRPPKK